MATNDINKMTEMPLDEFLKQLASSAPVPGGGGASALVGALAISLGNMVGSLTTGKKKYADVEDDIQELNAKSEKLRLELLSLMAKDAEVFEPLSKAYAIPKDDPTRNAVMAKALEDASLVPLAIMQKCAEAIDIIEEYAQKGSRIAISDAGCGAALAQGALRSAALNVFINTKAMQDRTLAASLNSQVDALLYKYTAKADDIYALVTGGLING